MVEAGLLIGLAIFNLLQFVTVHLGDPVVSPPDTPAAAELSAPAMANPYAEAERSRAILAAQEGAPSFAPTAADRAMRMPPGAARVIDGDTFDYRGERIRIADIDTPEMRGRCPEERAQAELATKRLRSLLAAGPFELVRSGRDEDSYGRKLRVVIRGGRSIGDTLVAEGLARTWTGRREPWC